MPGDPRLHIEVLVRGEREGVPRLDTALRADSGITVVMGASGAGKTTLLAAVAGLVRPDAGRIVLDGRVLFDASTGAWVPPHRRRVALVFQSLALFPHMLVWQNVAYGLPERRPAERRDSARKWLAKAHVEHVFERMPSTLSGGEAQRVALARALASEPCALLLDEPFSALDVALRRRLGAELLELVTELSIPTLFVTHDHQDAALLGSRTYLLELGRTRHF